MSADSWKIDSARGAGPDVVPGEGDVMTTREAFRLLAGRTPRIRILLGASFNHDWMLDHPTAASVYAAAFDGVSDAQCREYRDEALLLQEFLPDDAAVAAYLRFVSTGLVPDLDLGLTPREWLDDLVVRLRAPTDGPDTGVPGSESTQ